jgi:hypothetical protein
MAATPKLEALPANWGPLDPADIITPAELSKRLQLPLSWIYEKSRANGKHGNSLPVLRCGRYLRFSWTDVVNWMRSNESLDK